MITIMGFYGIEPLQQRSLNLPYFLLNPYRKVYLFFSNDYQVSRKHPQDDSSFLKHSFIFHCYYGTVLYFLEAKIKIKCQTKIIWEWGSIAEIEKEKQSKDLGQENQVIRIEKLRYKKSKQIK